MNPDSYFRAAKCPFRGVFYLLGWQLEVESNDQRVLEAARSSFSQHREGKKVRGPIRLRLLRDHDAESTGPWPRAIYRSAEDLFAIHCADSVAVIDMNRKFAAGFFSDAMLADAEFFRWTFLEALAYIILTRRHFTPVHAACVVRKGRAVLLCGPSGAGKSSLAYFCAKNGYVLLAEDAVFLGHSPRDISVRGNPSRLHFTKEARTLFPEMVHLPVSLRRNGEECLLLKPSEARIPVWKGKCKARAVVVLNRLPKGSATPRLERLAARQVARGIYDYQRNDHPAVMKAHLVTIRRLVRCGAYRASYSTLEEALELLGQIP